MGGQFLLRGDNRAFSGKCLIQMGEQASNCVCRHKRDRHEQIGRGCSAVEVSSGLGFAVAIGSAMSAWGNLTAQC